MKNYIKNMSKKDLVLLNIRKMYDSYGYKKISLPSFEEYDLIVSVKTWYYVVGC